MGKTTKALEKIVNAYYDGDTPSLDSIKKYHFDIMNQLFERNHPIYDKVNNLFVEIEWVIKMLQQVHMLTNTTKLFRWVSCYQQLS